MLNLDWDSAPEILFDVENGVAKIKFARPYAWNALTLTMYEALAEICQRAVTDNNIRVLIVSGMGEQAFSAGTDVSHFRGLKQPSDVRNFERRIERVLSALESFPKPTIASISGVCTGAGAVIAACCDLRIAAPTARLGIPGARLLGNCLSMQNLARLSVLIGPARVKEWVFTGQIYSAQQAKEAGFLSDIVDDADALAARVASLAASIAANAPLALKCAKEGLRRLEAENPDHQVDDPALSCYMSADFREGVEAFFEKRPPRWHGR